MNCQVEFCSHVGNLSLLRNYVRQFLGRRQCPEEDRDLLILGLDEACTNIIRHAYQNREDQLICLRLETLSSGNGVRFRLRDYAANAPDPSTFRGRDLDDPRPGGLGMHFITRIFDRVYFRRRRDGTELVLTKVFHPSPAPPPTPDGEPCRRQANSRPDQGPAGGRI